MINKNFNEVIIFARPWDLDVFLEIAHKLCRDFSINKIKVITAWKSVVENEILKQSNIEVYDIISLSKSWNKSQPINLSALDDFEEHCIKRGITMNTIFSSERFLPKGADNISNFFYANFHILDFIISEKSLLLSNQADHYVYWLAVELNRFKGGTYFGFCLGGRPSMWTQILSDERVLYNVNKPTRDHIIKAEEEYYKIINKEKIGYMLQSKKTFNVIRPLRIRIEVLKERLYGNYFYDGFKFLGGLYYLKNKFKFNFIKRKIRHYTLKELNDEKIIYLALHFEPEASTLVYSPFLNNQFFWLESVIKSIPQTHKLVIKENPKMHGIRNLKFYSSFLKYPNVRWIDPNTDSIEIVKRSELVLTITGTVAIESLAHKKKVIMFGKPPFSYFFNDINYISDMTKLTQVILDVISKKGPNKDSFIGDYSTYIANLIPDSFVKKLTDGGTMKMQYYQSYYNYIFKVLKND